MRTVIILLTMRYLTLAYPVYHSGHGLHLNFVPDISYTNLHYPLLSIEDFGEYVYGVREPEVIRIVKTVAFHLRSPYRTRIWRNVIPQTMKVRENMKISQPHEVENLNSIAVKKPRDSSYKIKEDTQENDKVNLPVRIDETDVPVESTTISSKNTNEDRWGVPPEFPNNSSDVGVPGAEHQNNSSNILQEEIPAINKLQDEDSSSVEALASVIQKTVSKTDVQEKNKKE